MPETRRSATDDDALAIRLIALFNDDQVLHKMKQVLYPHDFVNKLEILAKKVESLGQQLTQKDGKIDQLEKVLALEIEADRHEQYTRRPNLRIQGLPETGNIHNTDEVALQLFNEHMDIRPPISLDDIERSHRLGPLVDKDGKPRRCAVIVRFRSERIRDKVFRSRTKLKVHNHEHPRLQVFINEDLTARRASLAYTTRQLKKAGKLNDCWTSDGKIVIKDLANKIVQINSADELRKY